jgi:sortase A
MVVGALLLIDAGLTLLWQEPLTALYAHQRQAQLAQDLSHVRVPGPRVGSSEPASARVGGGSRSPMAHDARFLARHAHSGDPLARLRIGRIGLSAVVVQGTAGSELSKGPGHYPGTPLPGEHGTVAIAGHRTTFGAWFRHIDDLRPGDPIRLARPDGTFTYRVRRTRVVPSDALWITHRVGYDQLVLSACHPLYSASQRMVVFARLVAARPRAG